MNIKYDENGLIPVITQDYESGRVLILSYMNRQAYEKTIQEGVLYYYSRSRKKVWKKGETSGNTQILKSLDLDCDGDALLAKVIQKGQACHLNKRSCFSNTIIQGPRGFEMLETLVETIKDRKNNPKEGSYTNYLFEEGQDKILKKMGEEASEVIIASKNKIKGPLVEELSDLLYHSLVLMENDGVRVIDLFEKLSERHG